ncbi:hypothetical protein HOR51_gp23 [Ralstonia phage phiAp1]|uniref:Uncharacterized protein n=1 Tax=Ralstonia phage phiAp1 TaxID=2783867 RepID=A0A1L7DS66_9CAUD|nr:hypothetical protein HOR51_gp23 [Ralstonia phage phiAp1]APU03164.1 hypothetical protein phiAp1_23 [Ralstonia phage phiAp1]
MTKIRLKKNDENSTQSCVGCAYEANTAHCPRLPDSSDGRRRALLCYLKQQEKGGNYIWIIKETT